MGKKKECEINKAKDNAISECRCSDAFARCHDDASVGQTKEAIRNDWEA